MNESAAFKEEREKKKAFAVPEVEDQSDGEGNYITERRFLQTKKNKSLIDLGDHWRPAETAAVQVLKGGKKLMPMADRFLEWPHVIRGGNVDF